MKCRALYEQPAWPIVLIGLIIKIFLTVMSLQKQLHYGPLNIAIAIVFNRYHDMPIPAVS
jgi:hypothetical protein